MVGLIAGTVGSGIFVPDGRALATGVTSVSAGSHHTCAVTADGAATCWGSNFFGQLGNGATSRSNEPTPVDVAGLASGVAAISAGDGHTCALMTAGTVKCWGAGGSPGDGTGELATTPVDVCAVGANAPCSAGNDNLLTGVVAISAGWNHTCALTDAGGLKCWGTNQRGELGDGTTSSPYVPVEVSGLDSGVSAVASGSEYTCALMSSGAMKCWGINSLGQLGDGTTTSRSLPADVSGLAGGAIAVAAGQSHTCAVTAAGGVDCWGRNDIGQLGATTTGTCLVSGQPFDCSTSPVTVRDPTAVTAVDAGLFHTCARTTASGLRCWGHNGLGQLGDGTTSSRGAPVDTIGLHSGVSAFSAGGVHSCANATSGGLECWGEDATEQLGAPTTRTCILTGASIPCSTTPLDVRGLGAKVPGNVDCTGGAGTIDAALVLQRDAGLIDTLPCSGNADVNGDGRVDALDALLILQFVAGLIDGLPP